MEFEQAKALLGAFEREKVEYVLVGSMALAAQGLVRATRDTLRPQDRVDAEVLRRHFGLSEK